MPRSETAIGELDRKPVWDLKLKRWLPKLHRSTYFLRIVLAFPALLLLLPNRIQGLQKLELEELSWVPVPDSLASFGLSPLGGGRTLVWSPNAVGILVLDGDDWGDWGDRQLFGVVQVAPAGQPRIVEVLDLGHDRILQYGLDGKFKGEGAKLPPLVLRAGCRTAAGWFLLGETIPGTEEVHFISNDGLSSEIWSFQSEGGSGGILSPRLSAGTDIAILSSGRFPFRTLMLDDEGQTVRELDPANALQRFSPDLESESWASLPVLELDRGYLQTLADVTSDERLLVLYGIDGTVRRIQRVNAPIGFIAADKGNRILYGARSFGHFELVTYQWRWIPE